MQQKIGLNVWEIKMSNFLDSHKINYHYKEISDMFEAKLEAPIYVEVSPTGILTISVYFVTITI